MMPYHGKTIWLQTISWQWRIKNNTQKYTKHRLPFKEYVEEKKSASDAQNENQPHSQWLGL